MCLVVVPVCDESSCIQGAREEKVLGIGVLQEQLAQFEGGVSKDASTFEIVRTRGLGLELSGHMGDACWASRYELISKEFPHISALNFVLEPGTKNERTAGACLLMETSVNGKPVFIIRGLNPIENVINKHDPGAFTREVVKYLESTVGQKGQIAIVIDDHAGGSSTNRPILFSYLTKLKNGLRRVPLPKNNNLRFNDYDITNDTYFVSSKDF